MFNIIKKLFYLKNISKNNVLKEIRTFGCGSKIYSVYTRDKINKFVASRNFFINSPLFSKTKDYYSILGVNSRSSLSDIKKAFYFLAKIYHPDRHINGKNNSLKFHNILKAYQVLVDEKERFAYDIKMYIDRLQKQKFTFITENNKIIYNFQALEIMLRKAGRLCDIKDIDEINPIEPSEEIPIKITFLESVKGVSKEFQLKVRQKCAYCNQGENYILCPHCAGLGLNSLRFNKILIYEPCKSCSGSKYIPRTYCKVCKNIGHIFCDKWVKIPILPGAMSNEIIRLHSDVIGKEVIFKIDVADDDYFRRIGNDIFTEYEMTLEQAIYGDTIAVRGIDTYYQARLEPGTQSHQIICFPGKGMKTHIGYGDHIVLIKLKIPRGVTKKTTSNDKTFDLPKNLEN